MEAAKLINRFFECILESPWLSVAGAVVSLGIIGTGIFSFLRRAKTQEKGPYFTESKLLSPPMERPAYSDRMAYVLAEISDLAYYRFEGRSGLLDKAVKQAMEVKCDREENVRDFLELYSKNLLMGHHLSLDFLEDILKNSQFKLLATINVAETQGIACKRTSPDEPPYIVIAFRGTEKKLADWLTDADAAPEIVEDTKVHNGFRTAFEVQTDEDGKTARNRVEAIIDSPEAKKGDGSPLPLFITGHSLGGALALLATRNVVPDINGACYTFGAPRVANYEYFKKIKTPIYRVVNSSDIVPMVPPGAFINVYLSLAKLLSWMTGFAPAISLLFDKLESCLDKLHGYRHCGDLRYLTDVAEGRFKDVKLLRNPPAIDRMIWVGKSVAASFFFPVKSHSMLLYRKKLVHIANDRNLKA